MAFVVLILDHCRKQVEVEIGEIPVAFVAKAQGSDLSEDDVKQFVAKEVAFLSCARKKLLSFLSHMVSMHGWQ
jgi:hypothetical protein